MKNYFRTQSIPQDRKISSPDESYHFTLVILYESKSSSGLETDIDTTTKERTIEEHLRNHYNQCSCDNIIDQKTNNEQSRHLNNTVLYNIIVKKSGGNFDIISTVPVNSIENISKVTIDIRTQLQRSKYNLQLKIIISLKINLQ